MFSEKNKLRDVNIKSNIERYFALREYLRSEHNKILFSQMGKGIFNEYNLFHVTGCRGSGRTTFMKYAFNPKIDFFISKYPKEFLKSQYDLSTEKEILRFKDEDIKLINERNCLINIKSLQALRGKKIEPNATIWIDSYTNELQENSYRKELSELINMIKNSSNNSEIVVAYT